MTTTVNEVSPFNDLLARFLRSKPADDRQRFAELFQGGREAAAAGHVSEIVDEIPAAEERASLQRRIRQDALAAALPPSREGARTGLASLDRDQFPAQLRAWLDDPDARTLVLAGQTGTGKTQAAYAVAAEACNAGAATRDRRGEVTVRELLVRAWTCNAYVAVLRPDGSPEPVWKIRDRARSAELLVLDDLGAETDSATTEHVRRELVELIDHRLEHRLRTVITTNLSSGMVTERFGDRLLSRLTEQATSLAFLGRDRRRTAKLGW